MKRDVQRIVLAAIIPLFLLFILYILKFLETGMDWDFTKLGVYPMEKRGVFGIFAHPLVHSSLNIFCPIRFLFSSCPGVCFISIGILRPISFYNLDRLRSIHLSYRQTGMAHRRERYYLRLGILPVF